MTSPIHVPLAIYGESITWMAGVSALDLDQQIWMAYQNNSGNRISSRPAPVSAAVMT